MYLHQAPGPPSVTTSVRSNDSSRKRKHLSTSRRNASYACVQCRKKRSRCRFENAEDESCTTCKRAQIKCELEPDTDMRTHRHRSKIQQDQQFLHQFVEFLSGSEAPQSFVQTIRDCIPEGKLGERLDELKKLVSEQIAGSTQDDSNRSVVSSTPSTFSGFTVDSVHSSPPATPDSHASDVSKGVLSEAFQLISVRGGGYIAPGAVRSFGNLAMTDSIMTNGYPPSVQAQQIRVMTEPRATCIPLNIAAEVGGVADITARAMMSFRDAARKMITDGASARVVLSMDGISLDLFFRDRTPSDPHTLSNWACEFGKAWSFMPMLTCLAAIHYVSSLMRWLILPCPETYALISPLLRPIDAQLMIPHTVDIDLCHFPEVRKSQLEHGGRWIDKVTVDSQRLLWPHGTEMCIEEAVVEAVSIGGGEGAHNLVRTQRFSPQFIEFIDDQKNWSVHRAMLEEVPELEFMKLHSDEIDVGEVAEQSD